MELLCMSQFHGWNGIMNQDVKDSIADVPLVVLL